MCIYMYIDMLAIAGQTSGPNGLTLKIFFFQKLIFESRFFTKIEFFISKIQFSKIHGQRRAL